MRRTDPGKGEERMKKIFTVFFAALMIACLALSAAAAETQAAGVKNGWVTEKKATYYYKNEKPVKGWKKIDKKWYYFDKKSKVLVCDTIAGSKKNNCYYVDEAGVRVTDKTIKAAVKFVRKHTKAADSPKKKLLACYDYFTDKCYYVNHGYKLKKSQLPEYGRQFLLSDRGNCFMGSAAMCYCAKVLGFKTRLGIGNSFMGPTAHGWAEVKIGKKWYLFDINRTRWFKGKNYRMVTYEKYPVKLVRKYCYNLKVKNGKVSWKKGKFVD